MSTNSYIGLKNDDGSIDLIYCHWDGYPDGVGQTLQCHYRSVEKVNELLSLGDISSLGELVGPPEGVPHDFLSPASGVTVAYHRDRHEMKHPPIRKESVRALLEDIRERCISYVYVGEVDEGKVNWRCWDRRGVKQSL